MDYKRTLNLPTTDFPMKADLPRREQEILAFWEKEKIYSALQGSRADRPLYVLHDGPPYANGHIHIGHALNKILKDIIVKAKAMEGDRVPFVPGWDCHGLPIEHQVVKELGEQRKTLGQQEIRKLCREYAEKYVAIQKEEFTRLGAFGDWDNPYLTMAPAYEAAILREFGKCVEGGYVYKGKKPVLWCASCETALAEAEVEYEEHTSPSIYVKLPITGFGASDTDIHVKDLDIPSPYLLIWTTTPWTLPANQAIAVHPDENYSLAEVKWQGKNETWILANKLLKPCMDKFGLKEGKDYRADGSPLRGSDLCSRFFSYSHPISKFSTGHILTAGFVTMDHGTGCVHIAPGHGQEDYELSLIYDELKVVAPVDDQGRFTAEVGVREWAGKTVFEANSLISRRLKEDGFLVHEETLTHSYPHCWRCKNPVIFRATEQWFISMEAGKQRLRERAVSEIDNVAWIPRWGRDRFYGMMSVRPDWCISRQRAWGVPIPAFTCRACGELLLDASIVEHVASLVERSGADIWFTAPAATLLPKNTSCRTCGKGEFDKETDILDVWFESGVSHAAVLKTRKELRWPADLYLEGSDQHRGWFHSSMLASLAAGRGTAPYKTVLTHGFVVDGEGKKMSKSAGNVIAPQEVIERHGAEILRLWVAATDFREDVRISPDILQQHVLAYRKIRNTIRFLVANLSDFEPALHGVQDKALPDLERWALSSLQDLIARATTAYTECEFHIIYHDLNYFCATTLSAFYLDVRKDVLYCSAPDAPERRATQRVFYQILHVLLRLMAPILSFTAEEIWQFLPPSYKKETSIFLCTFPRVKEECRDEELTNYVKKLLSVRDEVAKELEKKRQEKLIGAPLEAKVMVYAGDELRQFLTGKEKTLAEILIVSALELHPLKGATADVAETASSETAIAGLRVKVEKARGEKCQRCWRWSESVGEGPQHPTLCDRCVEVVDNWVS